MLVDVKYFGKLIDITRLSDELMFFEDNTTVATMEKSVTGKYEGLKTEAYALFLNNKLVSDKLTLLKEKDEISFMPPFAGG